jgi:predicted choloylglycine hydrolase
LRTAREASDVVRKTFSALSEPVPGAGWQADFRAAWPNMRAWYLSEGLEARPTVETVRAALDQHMPELLAVWQRLCGLAGDDPVAHRFLGLYGRPRVIGRCSQAVWLGAGGPALLRNYDFEPERMMGRIDATRWFSRPVIAMGEAAWGCLDGMNGDGLVASLTFGGGRAYALGFSISLMMRYVLETCRTVAEAATALGRIPIAQSQNVTLLDASGAHAVVYLGPDRMPAVTSALICTNHQESVTWPEIAARSGTVERHAALSEALSASTDIDALAAALLAPPLYVRGPGVFTAYTAIYRPTQGAVDYLWPGKRWHQRFDAFVPGRYEHDYGADDSRRPM